MIHIVIVESIRKKCKETFISPLIENPQNHISAKFTWDYNKSKIRNKAKELLCYVSISCLRNSKRTAKRQASSF